MPESDQQRLEIARCNAFHVLARAFDLPRDMDDRCPELLRETLLALDESLHSAAQQVADEWQKALLDREALSVAYAGLFLGPFEVMAPPYASMYLDPERRLMGHISVYVAQCYAEAGLGPANGPNEAPDHVAHELEFMYFTAFREINEGEPVWAERQRRFWFDHVNRWLPILAKNIAAARCHPFYDALAGLLTSFCNLENKGGHYRVGDCFTGEIPS
jgi:TorA maturation chaperone TorD